MIVNAFDPNINSVCWIWSWRRWLLILLSSPASTCPLPPQDHMCSCFKNALSSFLHLLLEKFEAFFNVSLPPSSVSGAAKTLQIKSLFKSSIPVLRDDMWNRMELGFLGKYSSRLQKSNSGWIRYIPTMVCPALIEFSIFDTKWQVQFKVWSTRPLFSRLYWMVGKKKLEVGSWRRLLGILGADKLQLAASRAGKTFCQQPDVGHNGRQQKVFGRF